MLVGFVLFIVTMMARSEAPQVYLLVSGEQSYYKEVSATFKGMLTEQEALSSVQLYTLEQARQWQQVDAAILVTIGSDASEFALKSFPDTNVLSLLMPVAAWNELLARMPEGSGRRAAVVIDQPVFRSLALGRLLVPEAEKVSTVFGPASVTSKPQLINAAEKEGIELLYADLTSSDNPIGVLAPLIKKADFFIAVADRAVFNKSVAKWLLYLSFRQKVPVIAYSKSYVQAGAMAAVFSSPKNIGRHGAELLTNLLFSNGVTDWRTYYPKYYTVEVNYEVAKALKIVVPDLKSLYLKYSASLDSGL